VSEEDRVRGIDKFLPTSRSVVLFWSIPVSAIGIFWQSPKIVKSLFTSLPPEQNWIGIALVVAIAIGLSSLLLVAELCVYASQNEHKVTRHYKYYAPEMNAKWLRTNARPKHYLFLLLILLFGFLIGKSL
jgi:hypothetical protein